MIGKTLTTKRLTLRPLEPSDARALLHYAQHNRDWLSPWEPTHPEAYYTQEGQRSILNQCREDRQAGTGVLFGIFEKTAEPSDPRSRRVIGRISISGVVRGIWQNGFVGYSIAHDQAGKGYVTEALSRVVRYGFEDLQLHRIQASIVPRNAASLKVAAKCKFRYEGRALRYLCINEVWEDHEIFALTREEVLPAARRGASKEP
ncbi:MAG: GNAT family N-acetyltransferase [Deltaproteobacteria bacterium]|nr:GNAT family N-acetyltransferase [Deltaproteobacteria bacterium]